MLNVSQGNNFLWTFNSRREATDWESTANQTMAVGYCDAD